jgi:hypothetical protein
MKRLLHILLCAIAPLMALQCSGLSPFAGTKSGSETTNGYVAGFLTDNAGGPAAHSLVMLIPAGYDPVKDKPLVASQIDTTDSFGAYRFDVVDSGTYAVQAVQLTSRTRILITGITVLGDTIRIPAAALRASGTMKIVLPSGLDSANGYLYIPGTTVFASLHGSNGVVTLDSVPSGYVPSVSYATTGAAAPQIMRYNVQVPSADTVTIAYPSWKYTRQLFLNTSTSGANISGNVYDFPVLVRLTSGNFDFSNAKSDGSDIRFAKSDGTTLPYEIERWDVAAAHAEVWVRIDTVYAFNDTQHITMYWGNPLAARATNGPAVFDTADGFKAVYHLSDANDATYDKYNGTNYGATDTAGIIGTAQEFHGTDSIVIPSRMGTPSSVTLSSWARLETVDSGGAEVVSISDAVLIRMDNIGAGPGLKGSFHYTSAFMDFYYTSVDVKLAKTGWHYLTYTFDGAHSTQTLYLDGAQIGVSNYTTPIYYASTGKSTYIGTHGNDWGNKSPDFDFTGTLDEIRVCRVVRNPNWIKLCYMNQKAVDALIVFK